MTPEVIEKIRALSPDLRNERPRRPSEPLGGIPGAARTLDKCRATLLGVQGDYEFDCPFDRRWMDREGINAGAFRDYVATGTSDADVASWLEARGEG
jgi:hypothetical protein